MRRLKLEDLLATREYIANQTGLGIPGTVVLGDLGTATNVAVISGLGFEDELNVLGPMTVLIEGQLQLIQRGWAVVLLLIRPTADTPQLGRPNREKVDGPLTHRAQDVQGAMAMLQGKKTVVMDVSDGPADGLIIDVSGRVVDLAMVAGAIPAANRVSGLVELQRQTGYVPFGTVVYSVSTPVLEVLTQPHGSGDLQPAIDSVFSPLFALGAIKGAHKKSRGTQMGYAGIHAILNTDNAVGYEMMSEYIDPFADVPKDAVIGTSLAARPKLVRCPVGGQIWGVHSEVAPGSMDALGFVLQRVGGSATHITTLIN